MRLSIFLLVLFFLSVQADYSFSYIYSCPAATLDPQQHSFCLPTGSSNQWLQADCSHADIFVKIFDNSACTTNAATVSQLVSGNCFVAADQVAYSFQCDINLNNGQSYWSLYGSGERCPANSVSQQDSTGVNYICGPKVPDGLTSLNLLCDASGNIQVFADNQGFCASTPVYQPVPMNTCVVLPNGRAFQGVDCHQTSPDTPSPTPTPTPTPVPTPTPTKSSLKAKPVFMTFKTANSTVGAFGTIQVKSTSSAKIRRTSFKAYRKPDFSGAPGPNNKMIPALLVRAQSTVQVKLTKAFAFQDLLLYANFWPAGEYRFNQNFTVLSKKGIAKVSYLKTGQKVLTIPAGQQLSGILDFGLNVSVITWKGIPTKAQIDKPLIYTLAHLA